MQLADDNNVPIVLTVQSLQDHAESSGEQLLGGASLDASDPLIEGSQLSYIGQVDDGTLRQVVLVDSSTLAICESFHSGRYSAHLETDHLLQRTLVKPSL